MLDIELLPLSVQPFVPVEIIEEIEAWNAEHRVAASVCSAICPCIDHRGN